MMAIELTSNAARRLFAFFYARKRHCGEAAILAGASPEHAQALGEELLRSAAVKKLLGESTGLDTVKAGLERLAFGRANDAVRLVFSEEAPGRQELERMDLFNVSEIKRVKGGGVEIRLFDRQKALERLLELETAHSGEDAAQRFFKALADASDGESGAGDVTADDGV
ncbi:MAG: terminase small subunit [Oscillospiraceae bacterium]